MFEFCCQEDLLKCLPGQSFSVQVELLAEEPLHGFPPFAGEGLLQDLRLVLDPSSQLDEHRDHFFHSPQLPSTV